MTSAATTGWQVGAPGYPVLVVDYNESDLEDEGLLYATVGPWQVRVGDRVCVRDADGLGCWAYVRGPWLGPEFVGVEVCALLSAHDDLNNGGSDA